MKKKPLFIALIVALIIGLITGCIFFHYSKVYKNYIVVADCIFEMKDKNLINLSWYPKEEFNKICTDSRVTEIINKNPKYFTSIFIMCEDEVAFRKDSRLSTGESGIAITRNNIEPVRFGGLKCPKDVTYKKIKNRVYRYTTGIFFL